MRKNLKIQMLLFFLMTCSYSTLLGQDITITKNGIKEEIYFDRSKACDKELVFMVVGQMPVYEGGFQQLEYDLQEVISFNKKVKEKFYLRCTVNCNGEIFGFQNFQKNSPEVREKIENALLKLQNWKAAKHRETQVDCFYGFEVKIKKGKIKISR